MASLPDKNLVISAALAEYTALRAEVTSRISGQDTMLNLYMTAVAAIFGFALSGHADLLILLVLPLLSTAARLLYHNHNMYIKLVSAYLDDQLRPLVTERLGEPGLFGWHDRSAVNDLAAGDRIPGRGQAISRVRPPPGIPPAKTGLFPHDPPPDSAAAGPAYGRSPPLRPTWRHDGWMGDGAGPAARVALVDSVPERVVLSR